MISGIATPRNVLTTYAESAIFARTGVLFASSPSFRYNTSVAKKRPLNNTILRRSSAVEQVTVETWWYTGKCMPDKRTYADRAEYIKRAVAKRRRTMRQRAVEYKGGKCSKCGYNKCSDALEFHHHDGRKDFGISQDGLTRSWERIEKELKRCILICANCHREEHAKLRSLAEKSASEE